jgi:GT2 family glycosyltransferase
MLFSVVIPTCDRPDLLRLCLDALAPGAQALREPFETIVSDDGTRPVEALIKDAYPWARWVQGPRRGPAANRNNGAALARGDWLAFTDDDCLPAPGWLESYRLAIAAQGGAAAAFEGAIHPQGDVDKDLAECPVNLTGGCFWSANICVRRGLFTELGGFDETFRIAAHEDQDLFIRVKKRTAVPFVKDAGVSHPVRYQRLWKSLKEMRMRSLNWLHFAETHAEDLGYRNGFGIIAGGYWSQLTAAYDAAKKGYPKQTLRAVAMLVYGMPFLAAHLARTRVGSKSSST